MESKYTMELVDRFAALLEENAQLRVKLNILEMYCHRAQEDEADYSARYRDENSFKGAKLLVTDIQSLFGFADSPIAKARIEEATNEG